MTTKHNSGGKPARRIVQRVTARKAVTAVCAAFVFLMLTAGAYASPKTDYDHSVNFEKYRTFAWKDYGMPANGVVNNSIVAARIRNAVNEQLVKRGMREDDRNPDVYVVVHIGAKNIADIDYTPASDGGIGAGCGPTCS